MQAEQQFPAGEKPPPDTVSLATQPFGSTLPGNRFDTEELPAQVGPYPIEGAIAQGGMGVVLRGRDPEFGRFLAVKLLLGRHKGNADLARRFLEEAAIAANLQHPGVPPIHTQGKFSDGRPYFTMKLIEGQTLSDLLHQRTGTTADLPRFLAIFTQVCQTLGYAHDRGIIHRDLKPGNIMVGAFGEVQVMDWGLAKNLRASSENSDAARESERSANSIGLSTQAGSVLGTLAYMPPEQARGQVNAVDARSDVFGLGAILCVILTGRPPYQGESGDAVHRQAVEGNLNEAMDRLDKCGADPEVIGLAKQCLQAAPERRPAHAGVLAETLARHQVMVQQRLRDAELASAAAQVEMHEERKRRKLTLALAVSLLVLGLLGGGAAWWVDSQRVEQEAEQARLDLELRQAVESSLDQAALRQKEGKFADTGVLLEQASKRLGESGPDDLRKRLKETQQQLELITYVDQQFVKKTFWGGGKPEMGLLVKEFPGFFQKAGLGEVGKDAPAVVAERIRASVIGAHFLAVVDEWALWTKDEKERAWLLKVARLVDPDPEWKDRVRDAKEWKNLAALEKLAQSAKGRDLPVHLAIVLSIRLQAQEANTASEALLRDFQERHPGDFWLNYELANSLTGSNKTDAMAFYRAALAVRPVAAIYSNLGSLLQEQDRLDEARAAYRKSMILDPTFAPPHLNLGNTYLLQRQMDQAMICYGKALDLDPKYMPYYFKIGKNLIHHKHYDEAILIFRRGLVHDPNMASLHVSLAFALEKKNLGVEALTHFQKGHELDRNNIDYCLHLGRALAALGHLTRALDVFRKTTQIEPNNTKNAVAYFSQGEILATLKREEEAMHAYRLATLADPKDAQALNKLGTLRLKFGYFDEAIVHFRAALELHPREPALLVNLGKALYKERREEEAIEIYQEALKLEPRSPDTHHSLAVAFMTLGRLDEARKALRKAQQDLPTSDKSLRPAVTHHLAKCDDLEALEKKLQRILAGEDKAGTGREKVDLAEMCYYRKLYTQSAHFYKDYIAENPKLVDSAAGARLRFYAAGAALLALDGKGKDAPFDPKEHPRWRKQARDWLRGELELLHRVRTNAPPRIMHVLASMLALWQRHPDLHSVRHADALAKLPTEEQKAWHQLWSDVTTFRRQLEKELVKSVDP